MKHCYLFFLICLVSFCFCSGCTYPPSITEPDTAPIDDTTVIVTEEPETPVVTEPSYASADTTETTTVTEPSESSTDTTETTTVTEPSESFADTDNDFLYGQLSKEDEVLVRQIAFDYFLEVYEICYPKELIQFTEDEIEVTLDAPVPWGKTLSNGDSGWTEKVEKMGLRNHPDRVAHVMIFPKNAPPTSALLVKPLDTDEWVIVNYGF